MKIAIRTCLVLFAGFSMAAGLRAQDAAEAFLLNPESAMAPGRDGTMLAVQVDGSAPSYAGPQILIYRNSSQAEFISAVWKDAAGQVSHQRDVFVVKPDYGVIVDYVYGKERHTIVRGYPFSSASVVADGNGAQAALAGGGDFRVQAIDGASARITSSDSGKAVVFSSSVTAPAPVSTVFMAAGPKVESVKPANPMIVKFKVTYPNGQVDQVAVAWESRPLHLNGKEFKGWAACLRQGPAGASSIEIH